MSYNDPTDSEAVLQVPPAPPAATPAGVGAPVAQSALQMPSPLLTSSPSGVPVAPPSNPPAPVQTQSSAKHASLQLLPTEPVSPPVIAPTTQTPLTVDGVDAAPQTPQTTQPGTLNQS